MTRHEILTQLLLSFIESQSCVRLFCSVMPHVYGHDFKVIEAAKLIKVHKVSPPNKMCLSVSHSTFAVDRSWLGWAWLLDLDLNVDLELLLVWPCADTHVPLSHLSDTQTHTCVHVNVVQNC